MYKYIAIFCFFLISLSVSAQFEKGTQEYKGMRYKIRQQTKGQSIAETNIVQVQMKAFSNTDSLLRETHTEDFPALIDLREEQNREMPLVEILMKSKIGDSLTVFMLSDSLFQDESYRPDFIPKGSWIRQEFRLVKTYTPEQYEEVKKLIQQSQQEQYEQTEIVEVEEGVEVVATEDQEVTSESYSDVDDAQQIEETVEDVVEDATPSQKDSDAYYVDNQEDYIENVYLKLNDITDYKKTQSGLFYKIEKQGTSIKKGEKVKIRYEETSLMTGEKLDSSHDSEKIREITIGVGNFIKGWEEGIPLIGKGGLGYLYIPSKLAYGKEEIGEQLEPNAMLIYKIEVLED